MGGRLDATNVLDLGVAAITNVQRDHEAHLGQHAHGDRRREGADHQARQPGRHRGLRAAACARSSTDARRLGVPFAVQGRGSRIARRCGDTGWDGIVVDARTPSRRLHGLRVGLLGAHQADNASVTLALLEALEERWGIDLDEDQLRAGMAAARWPGRLELLEGSRIGLGRVLLDGAHNPAGAAALARALADLGLRRPTIVFGAMRGKKVREVLRSLMPLDPRFVFTRVDDPGALAPSALADAWAGIGGRGGVIADTPAEALRRADADPVVVAGSLYLVGAVRGMIVPEPEEE